MSYVGRASLLLALVLVLARSSSATTVSTFSGGDVGEGLDLDGTFVYAVNLGGTATGTVRSATFTTEAGAGAGYSATGPSTFSGLVPVYGATANDNVLEPILSTVRFHPTVDFWDIALGSLISGHHYVYQLLLHEVDATAAFNNFRLTDVFVEGALEVNDLDLFDLGSRPANGVGVVVTGDFYATAGNTTLDIRLDREASYRAMLNALTVEDLGVIPEPDTSALLSLGLVGIGVARRRGPRWFRGSARPSFN